MPSSLSWKNAHPSAALPRLTGWLHAARSVSGWWPRLRADWREKGWQGCCQAVARMVGVLLRWPAHRRLLKTLGGAHTAGIFAAYPRVAFRYTLPYLSTAFARPVRFRLLQAHYQFLNERVGPSFFPAVLAGTLVPWCQEAGDTRLEIRVTGPCPVTKHREGDLGLVFMMNGQALYRVAFSIVRLADVLPASDTASAHDTRHALYIGQVQGVSGTYELMRAATAQCDDVAPQDTLMACLAGLAQALSIGYVVGVERRNSISLDLFSQSSMSFDYDAFWAKYQGQGAGLGQQLIALPFHEKPLSDIQARHRKRASRKRVFRQAVTAQAFKVLRPLVECTGAD